MSKRNRAQKAAIERVIDSLTRWIGSPLSLIVHTLFFSGCFVLLAFGIELETVLLTLTTVVSLEAIYLALFIQMTVNRATTSLEAVEEDIAEIEEDVQEIHEDVAEIEKSIDEIEEDVAEIEKDIDEIQEDVDDIEEQKKRDAAEGIALQQIEVKLSAIVADLERLRK